MPSLAERKLEYDTHKTAGYDYYNSMRAQQSLDVQAGTKTIEQVNDIYNKLDKVIRYVLQGDWKGALYQIDNVLPNVNCPQALIDQVKTDIQNYITNNYTW